LTRDELQKLLKVTSRAIDILLVWKKLWLGKHPDEDDSRKIYKVNDSIAELSEVKLGLKNKLKGNGDFSLPEKFQFLNEAYETSKDPEERKLIFKKLAELTKKTLTEVIMEVNDDQG